MLTSPRLSLRVSHPLSEFGQGVEVPVFKSLSEFGEGFRVR